jgi:hypothetical protein
LKEKRQREKESEKGSRDTIRGVRESRKKEGRGEEKLWRSSVFLQLSQYLIDL